MFRFLHPELLGLLALVPPLLWLTLRLERKGRARIIFSDLSAFQDIPPSPRIRLKHLPLGLRACALSLLIVALARPQYGNQIREILSKGIDIMIVLDCSGSMRENDMTPNRLEVAKEVVTKFISGREEGFQNDRIGLVTFSRVAFTRCPLTVDYAILKKIVSRVDFTPKEFDGTAIGDALATAVARLADSQAKSKVIILVSDGQNNAGMNPMMAAALAEALQIKVYTIAVVPATFMTRVQDKIFGEILVPIMPNVDETQMKAIAERTAGRYFRAQDEKGLADIFAEIDRLEKTEVKVKEFYRYSELYRPWAGVGLLLLLLETVLSRTVFRRLP